MQIIDRALNGVLVLQPKRHGDARGWFSEVYKRSDMLALGLTLDFV